MPEATVERNAVSLRVTKRANQIKGTQVFLGIGIALTKSAVPKLEFRSKIRR